MALGQEPATLKSVDPVHGDMGSMKLFDDLFGRELEDGTAVGLGMDRASAGRKAYDDVPAGIPEERRDEYSVDLATYCECIDADSAIAEMGMTLAAVEYQDDPLYDPDVDQDTDPDDAYHPLDEMDGLSHPNDDLDGVRHPLDEMP